MNKPDEKDKKIQALEKEVERLKKIMALFEKQLKQVNSRLVHADDRARRTQHDIDQLKRRA